MTLFVQGTSAIFCGSRACKLQGDARMIPQFFAELGPCSLGKAAREKIRNILRVLPREICSETEFPYIYTEETFSVYRCT